VQLPLVDLRAQYATIKPAIDAAIERVVSCAGFILGREVAAFEEAFARHVQAEGAVGVASGTAALTLSLQACGIGPGDEVITVAHTFIATAEAISQVGARPVFVDVDPRTYTLDAAQAAAAISERTRALLPVHLYGHPAEMDPLMELARRHRLWCIEDAAQAHGAEYKGRRCGSIGHLACFSFFPGKNLGAYGDAGMVTGMDRSLLDRVRKLRDHGRVSKYEHDELGFCERMDALQAAVLAAKLPYLEDWTEARRRNAARYSDLLRDCGLPLPHEAADARHVYHLYVVRTPHRDRVLQHLQAKGVAAGVHYPIPVHRQPAYAGRGYATLSLPVTEALAGEVLSLPMYPELTPEQIAYVAETVREAVCEGVS
jgi:dTDP-4-amino-4,6-dideoxygalactose transaminase